MDQVLDEFADEKMQQHVNRYFGDYVKSTGLRFEMLANDGVEKCVEPIVELTVEGIIDEFCEYDDLAGVDGPELVPAEVLLREPFAAGAGGRLPSDLFAESKRDYIWAQNATIIQRACRGRMGRDRVRQKLARTYRKRWDGRRFYYVNLDRRRRADRRPRLIGMLFPRSVYLLVCLLRPSRPPSRGADVAAAPAHRTPAPPPALGERPLPWRADEHQGARGAQR